MRRSLRAPVFHYCHLNELGINTNIWILSLIFSMFALLNIYSLINPTVFFIFWKSYTRDIFLSYRPQCTWYVCLIIVLRGICKYVSFDLHQRRKCVFLKYTAWLGLFGCRSSESVSHHFCLFPDPLSPALPILAVLQVQRRRSTVQFSHMLVPSSLTMYLTHCVTTSVVTVFFFREVTFFWSIPFLLQGQLVVKFPSDF